MFSNNLTRLEFSKNNGPFFVWVFMSHFRLCENHLEKYKAWNILGGILIWSKKRQQTTQTKDDYFQPGPRGIFVLVGVEGTRGIAGECLLSRLFLVTLASPQSLREAKWRSQRGEQKRDDMRLSTHLTLSRLGGAHIQCTRENCIELSTDVALAEHCAQKNNFPFLLLIRQRKLCSSFH